MRKWTAVALVALSLTLVMALWFSASAGRASLETEFRWSGLQAAFTACGTSLGFVLGCFLSALFGIADRHTPQKIFLVCAWAAAGANLSLLYVVPGEAGWFACLFLIGVFLAGVYPVAVKIVSSWEDGDIGMLLGLIVGALTLGSAAPHLVGGLVHLNWRLIVEATSGLAILGGAIAGSVASGPAYALPRGINRRHIWLAFSDVRIRYANLGYLGHMWELYPMWAWISAYLSSSAAGGGYERMPPNILGLWAFAVIGVGVIGSILGGLAAERMGSSRSALFALVGSGGCALLAALVYEGAPVLVLGVAMLWGATIIADSAQFSACVVRYAPPEARGTLITIQICLGFGLTTINIVLLPFLIDAYGWRLACLFLAIGPWIGAWCMRRLVLMEGLPGCPGEGSTG